MTIVQSVQIEMAQKVFESWDKLGVNGRAQLLQPVLSKLSEQEQKMAQWQISNALKEIGETQIMPGPTGERNELSSQGRGAFLCVSFAQHSQAKTGLIGQIIAALIAGNPVITVGSKGQGIMDLLAPSLPEGVIQNVAESAQDSIIEAEHLAGIAVICKPEEALSLNQRLAAKNGLICQLVEETNVDSLNYIASPHYILRFVTERTVSINTTAIGGNATLLELGSMDE
ncbi:1-pyrroline-5-carboxylate dehydrogenase [Marinomonas epiphytica]